MAVGGFVEVLRVGQGGHILADYDFKISVGAYLILYINDLAVIKACPHKG